MSLEMKYFVLKPRSKTLNDYFAHASRQAILTYANFINNEELAKELRDWVAEEVKHCLSLSTDT
jgi:hypothetical protein